MYDCANLLRYTLGSAQKRDYSPSCEPSNATITTQERKHDQEAETLYQQIISLQPEHSSALGELAQLSLDMRQDEVAAKTFVIFWCF